MAKAELRRLTMARFDIEAARDLCSLLTERGSVDGRDWGTVAWGLWTGVVCSYARPFKRATLQLKDAAWSTFDDAEQQALHDRLIILRDTLFAHNDRTPARDVVLLPPGAWSERGSASEQQSVFHTADIASVVKLCETQLERIEPRIEELVSVISAGLTFEEGAIVLLAEIPAVDPPAEDEERHEWSFELGVAFPAGDPLARFVTDVSMGLNDTLLSNEGFVAADEAHASIYYFKLASGHLWELAHVLGEAYEQWPEVRDFIGRLQQSFQEDFAAVIEIAAPADPTGIGDRLRRLRNGFFHYPSLRRSTAERGRLPLMHALRDAHDLQGLVTIDPTRGELSGIRALFADEVAVKLLTAGYQDGELERLVSRVAQLQAAYNRFAQAVLGRYLREMPNGLVMKTRA
jgi:hypothetical protein